VASGKARFRPCRVSHADAIPHGPEPAWAALMELSGPSRSQESLVSLGILRFSNGQSVSGSVGLSHVPRDLRAVAGRAFRGFPSSPPSAAEALERRPSWPCSLLQSARESAGTTSRRPLLSWDSSVALPPAYPTCVHSQEPRLPSGRRCHTPTPVPPSWFRTTSTVCSAHGSRVCCTPQPVKGSPRFMLAACPRRPKATRSDGDNPRDAVHTLRRFPLASSRTTSLWPLPSCRYRPARRWCPGRDRVPLPTASPPRRVAYTPLVLPAGRQLPCPEGWGGWCPVRWGVRASEEVRDSSPVSWCAGLRGAPVAGAWAGGPCPSRGGGAGPPRRSGFPVPVGGGAVLRGARCPVPARRGVHCSEERRLPAPVGGVPIP